MKKTFFLLFLAVSLFLSACNLEVPSAPSETSLPEATQMPSIPETTCTTEAPDPIEAAPLPTDYIFQPKAILLDPSALRSESAQWAVGGSLVYFGQYDSIPAIYRILAPSPDTQSLENGADCLLLDCGRILRNNAFDNNFSRNEGQQKQPSEWKGSDLELWLNGTDFYGDPHVFSDLERAAIAATTLADATEPYQTATWTYTDYGSTDFVFLLSASEADALYKENAARLKDGISNTWWLRSAFGNQGNGCGSVHGDGHICNNSISNFAIGVSPAFNIRLSSILFASELENKGHQESAEEPTSRMWKLTLLDPSKSVTIPEGQTATWSDAGSGPVLSIPYRCSGVVNQLSILITDLPYTEESAQAIYYGPLQRVYASSLTETAQFPLPVELVDPVMEGNCHIYLLAEAIHLDEQTNYAGIPFELTAISEAP